jgi:hypothetical protein
MIFTLEYGVPGIRIKTNKGFLIQLDFQSIREVMQFSYQ